MGLESILNTFSKEYQRNLKENNMDIYKIHSIGELINIYNNHKNLIDNYFYLDDEVNYFKPESYKINFDENGEYNISGLYDDKAIISSLNSSDMVELYLPIECIQYDFRVSLDFDNGLFMKYPTFLIEKEGDNIDLILSGFYALKSDILDDYTILDENPLRDEVWFEQNNKD